jgi:hypothetical protein
MQTTYTIFLFQDSTIAFVSTRRPKWLFTQEAKTTNFKLYVNEITLCGKSKDNKVFTVPLMADRPIFKLETKLNHG